jgi:hypothetical protein
VNVYMHHHCADCSTTAHQVVYTGITHTIMAVLHYKLEEVLLVCLTDNFAHLKSNYVQSSKLMSLLCLVVTGMLIVDDNPWIEADNPYTKLPLVRAYNILT